MIMLAAIRIRGPVGVPKAVEDTLKMLRLTRVNHCALVPKNKSYEGMLQKVRSYITWGEIDKETLSMMVTKRGRVSGNNRLSDKESKEISGKIEKSQTLKDSGIKLLFRLSPGSGGLRSTKMDYPRGDLGYRGEKINSLLRRML
jgi:large subunit ribosomal protein L30